MDASEITRRIRERTIYANYLAQKNRIDGGCGSSIRLSNNGGSSFESSLIPSLKEGELFTTPEQRDAILAASACEPNIVETRDAIYLVGQFNTDPITFYAAQDEFAIDLYMNDSSNEMSSFLVKFNLEGLPLWSTRINSVITDNSDSAGNEATIVHVSSDSIIYVAGKGYHNGPDNYGMYFYNAGSSTPDIIFTPTSPYTVWLCEYNSEGQVQWATHMDGEIGNRLFITSDSNHDVYVQVHTYSNINIYNASDHSTIVQTINNISNADTMLIKFDSNGQYLWHSLLSGANDDNIASIVCDYENNVYCAVAPYGDTTLDVYSPPSYGSPSFSIVGDRPDGFNNVIIKYNSSGLVLWGTRIAGAVNVGRFKMIIDTSNHLYGHGMYEGGSTNIYSQGDQSTPVFTLTSSGGWNSYVVKFTSSGVATWVSKIIGLNDEIQPSISIDSNNNLYVVAESNSASIDVYDAGAVTPSRTITFNGLSNTKICIIKYNASGISSWTSFFGPFSSSQVRNDIKANTDGTLYITGRIFNGNTINFYDASGNTPISEMSNISNAAILLVKYNSNGAPVWRTITNRGINPQLSV